ncbi:conserved hypothetical protein [Ixodes scapularis]|uniref:Uncharacterized protein n=1 Tax=Ixodes scapularis TaxID=6945 RepID=B7PKS6_IXOSC|nr:conserved hypothetical protein [Ixodes scapularis]|eukprot:XP_002434374.1 conserved hypothetical protein [Ixodes scapularis]
MRTTWVSKCSASTSSAHDALPKSRLRQIRRTLTTLWSMERRGTSRRSKLAEEAAEREAREEEEDEKNNPMKLLEKRTQASKQEMDLIEALEDLKDLNKRQANVNFDAMLGRYAAEREAMLKRQEEEDENLIS